MICFIIVCEHFVRRVVRKMVFICLEGRVTGYELYHVIFLTKI